MPRKPTRAFKDIELLGGWDAVTKLLAAQKTGKRRLKDEQIKTGLAVSVGGVRKRLVLQKRRSDHWGLEADSDPGDPVRLRVDLD
jgi:hypothetical protein